MNTMFDNIGNGINMLRKPIGNISANKVGGLLNKVTSSFSNPGAALGNYVGSAIGKAIFPQKTPTPTTPKSTTPVKQAPKTTGLINNQPTPSSAPSPAQTFQAPQATPTPTPTQTQTSTPTITTPPTDSFSTNVQNLTNFGSGKEAPEVTKARQDLLDFEKEKANQTREINTGGTWTSRALGQQHQADIQNAATEGALQSAVANAQTSQGQQIGAAQQGGSLSQPVGQFGVLTNPQTGQPVNGLSATNAAQQGGYIQGLQQGAQAQGAVSGTTNAANAANAGTQAFGVNLALSQVNSLTPVIKNFLSQTGINPSDGQIYNAPISTYLSRIQASGQLTQWNTLMSELNRYSSQLIGTGALTPTGVTAATQLQDPSKLSLAQIDGVLQTLKDVGNNQVYNLQQQTNQALPGNSIYTGGTTSPVTSTSPAPVASPGTPGGGITNPVGQFGAGMGLNALDSIWGSVKDLGGELLGFLARSII